MESPASVSKSTPFKSKNKLPSELSDPSPLASKTPEKHSLSLSSRARNRSVALSIFDIRKAAESLRESNRCPQTGSAKKQIFLCDSLVKRSGKSISRLPEKYETLAEFFDSLDSSIRLLKLKGSMPTFTNVCSKIEALTDKRFTYRHLSQLKFIVPEALEFKVVLTPDEPTSSMKPTLHITLNADAVEKDGNSKAETANMNMRRVFQSRLRDFVNAHPEGDEVPEGPLPESFNHLQHDFYSDILLKKKLSLTAERSTEETVLLPLAKASHLPHNFQRHFSHRVRCVESGKSRQMPTEMSIQSSAFPPEGHNEVMSSEDEPSSSSPSTQHGIASETNEKHVVQSVVMESSQYCCPASTPNREKSFVKSDCNYLGKDVGIETTPAKLVSTPARLMAATPALRTPKRCHMSPEDSSTDTPNKLVRRLPRMRSLKFDTPVKNENVEAEREKSHVTSHNDDLHDILSYSLIQSIKAKEKKAMAERDPAISQAKKRQQTIAALPKLFNTIHFLFKSSKLSVITKEELVYKVIASPLDIVDRREVEDQIDMLMELAPEWISEKVASTGDLLLCINKASDPQTVRSKIADAK